MRIDFGMSHRRRQPIDLLRTETMFLPLRFDVHAIERHAELLGKIDLPQPVRAHDVQRQALAFCGQPQMRPVAVNETFVFEALSEREQHAIAETQLAFQRLERSRVPIGRLTKQMLEGVFRALASGSCAVPPDECGEAVLRHQHRKGQQR
jgi:hypothetical protein